MAWGRQIDNYCERSGPEFWSEPVNALTNGAFVLVGLAALLFLWRSGRRDPVASLLAVVAIAIGIGSFLFHSFATAWAQLADVLPIQVFILLYFGAALHRFAGLRVWPAMLATAAFLGAAKIFVPAASQLLDGALNRSEMYLPALVALFGIGGWLARQSHPAARALLAAGAVFTLSIFFRSIDMAVCAAFPLGTHFLWHLLNAAVIGILLAAHIRHRPSA